MPNWLDYVPLAGMAISAIVSVFIYLNSRRTGQQHARVETDQVEIDHARVNVAIAAEKREQSTSAFEQLESVMHSYIDDVQRVKSKLDECEERATRLQKTIEGLNTEVLDLRRTVVVAREEHTRLRFDMAKLERSYDALLVTVEAITTVREDTTTTTTTGSKSTTTTNGSVVSTNPKLIEESDKSD